MFATLGGTSYLNLKKTQKILIDLTALSDPFAEFHDRAILKNGHILSDVFFYSKAHIHVTIS